MAVRRREAWPPRYETDQGIGSRRGDQFVVLFEREVAEDVGKVKEFHRMCIELRANIRLRNDYISKLRVYRSCDDVLEAIKTLRRMQSDDTKKAARLLSMARET
nr:hypothetical protein [Tanacetum cinerariifolium]